jgi:hypothetical protein
MGNFRRKVPRDAALELARLAEIPDHEIESFCDAISHTVDEVWQKDHRGISPRRSAGLVAAAKAALALNRAVCNLNKRDRKWLGHILKKGELVSWSTSRADDIDRRAGRPIPVVLSIDEQVWAIASDLSTTAGLLGPPPWPGIANHRPRISSVKDISFSLVVRRLRSWATECRGRFTYNKRYQSGSLLLALEVLRPHLPDRVIPRALPLTTIDRIIAASNRASRPMSDQDLLNQIASIASD